MKRRSLTVAAAGIALLGLASFGAPAAQAQIGQESTTSYSYILNEQNPQQGLGTFFGQTAAGTPVMTREVTGGADQQWALTDQRNGTTAIQGRGSRRCIAATAEHGPAVLENCSTMQFSQRWYEERRPGGKTIFENALYEGQCLEMAGPDRLAVLTDCNGSSRQSWKLMAP